MFRNIKAKVTEAVKCYPFNRRISFTLSICISFLVATISWRFESAKAIALFAFGISGLFEFRSKWFMFFLGIALGDMLLYLWK